jgi:hypothetical protein
LPVLFLFYNLLHTYNYMGITPQPFQVIIGALLGGKQVDNHITKVNKQPAAGSISFVAPGNNPGVLFGLFA